ncbi:hypothetical protein HBI56_086790 [Parastagonospora nodorum]|nr:hypothetical protein HBH97_107090 [Parastagonospora nodorum]KAH4966598.1 hypothetical protein HBI78_084150 [Parastagonospora nodorum]KAH5102357.1 hypothetical protein HBH72_084300 [Parastagonospora nodorum]KAH5190336.1 hypothetical protein HBH77_157280 [Parastagonospora nodorum]KAH5203579.1 hypothetical protein HBH68_102490 [Parastagonospora nodorum]
MSVRPTRALALTSLSAHRSDSVALSSAAYLTSAFPQTPRSSITTVGFQHQLIMKLLSLLLLGATALAVAVPAPLVASNTAMAVYARDVDDAPGPDTPYAFKITVHPRDLISMPSLGMDAPATDGIWDYQVTFTEHFNGKMLHCQGNISTRSGDFVMDYEGEGKFIWVKLNDYDMHIFWDWNEHRAWFKFREAKWALDKDSASGRRAGCEVKSNWSRDVIYEGATESRSITSACWIRLVEGETIGTQHGLPGEKGVITRDISSNAAAESQRYNYAFDISITEFCEASEGTPLKARAYWQPSIGPEGGVNINFDDEATVMLIAIGGFYLTVGSYDFTKHQLGFHYNGCNWNQDIIGVGECGLCHSKEWSAPELDCASNAAAGRTHSLKCYFKAQL